MLSIVVGDLYSAGAPRRGAPLKRTSEVGGVYVSVEMTAHHDRVDCLFTRVIGSRKPERHPFEIPISRTEPNYGGTRVWFHCSHLWCGRRVARLFLDAP